MTIAEECILFDVSEDDFDGEESSEEFVSCMTNAKDASSPFHVPFMCVSLCFYTSIQRK